MAVDGGICALDRLRTHLDDVARQCPDCGYRDEEGEWRAAASGRQITYRHTCPSCGAEHVRRIRVG